jgi:hypothetical protein
LARNSCSAAALSKRLYKQRHPKRVLLNSARDRAKKYGLPFDLTEGDFSIPETCPVLGVQIAPGTRTSRSCSPSLDRIIPKLGYVRGNVRVISNRANLLKSDASTEELTLILLDAVRIQRG